MATMLPVLEVPCVECNGEGREYSSEDDAFVKCPTCNGFGLVPTEEGKSILNLLRHSRMKLVSAELCVAGA